MALVLADRIRETTTTAGTGTITLAGAVTGYRSFATVGNGNTTYYTIAGQNTSEWEVGIGTYTSVGTTLSRTTVLASSNAGSLVTFSAGTKDVFVTYPAGKSIYQDANGGVSIAAPTSGNALSVTSVAGSYPLLTTSASTSSFNASFATSTGGTFGYIGCGTSLAAGAADADMGLYSASGKIFIVGSQGLTIKTGVAGSTSTRMTLTNTGSFTINAPTSGVALLVNGTTTSGSNSNAFNVFTDSTNYATHVLRNTNAAGNAAFSVQGGNAVLDVAVNANFGSLLGSIGTNTAHSFALNTSGTARLTINSTGNITVATPTSGTAINVNSLAGTYSFLANDGTCQTFIYSNAANGATIGTLTNHKLEFQTNNIVRAAISSTGNVTIAAPTSGNALTLNTVGGATSPLVITGVASQTGANISTSTPSGTTNYWRLSQTGIIGWDLQNIATTGEFRITNGTQIPFQSSGAGNVTINAPTSGTTLTVNAVSGGAAAGLYAPAGQTCAVYLYGNNSGGSLLLQAGSDNNSYLSASNSLYVNTGGSNRIFLNNNGNFSIPTAAVSGTTFNVVGTASGSRLAEFGGNLAIYESASRSYVADFDWSSTTFRIRPWTATGSTLELHTTPSGGSTTSRVAINSTGNVTINAPTSGAALTVNGVTGYYTEYIENPGQAGVRLNTAGTTGIYTAYAQSGTIGAYIGIGSSVITGAASTDLGITSNGGNIYFGRSAGSATAMQIANAGNVTVNQPTSGPALTVNGSASTPPVSVTFSATAMTVNCALSNVFTTTFTANVTTAPTISNPQDGQTINWFITQDATGTRTMTWPTSFKWQSGASTTLTTGVPNAVDLVVATYRSSTGFWYATLSKYFV